MNSPALTKDSSCFSASARRGRLVRFSSAAEDAFQGLGHHHHPESGWVSVPIRGDGDVPHIVELFRLSYDRPWLTVHAALRPAERNRNPYFLESVRRSKTLIYAA
jgi:hypothetical protein